MMENVALPPVTVLPTRVSVHAPGFSVDVAVEPMRMRIWRSSLLACGAVDVISMPPHAVWMVPALSPGLTVIDAAQPGPATLTPYELAPGYHISSWPLLTVPGTLN